MKVVVYPRGIVDVERPGQGIMDIAGADFMEIVLDTALYCNPYELELIGMPRRGQGSNRGRQIILNPQIISQMMEPLLSRCNKAGLIPSIGAAPFLCRDTKRKDLNELLQKLTKESIEVCGKAGCRYLIVRPLFAGISNEDIWDVNRKFYLYLGLRAKEYDMMLLLENQCKNINGHLARGICSDGGQAAQWVDWLNQEAGECRFGFCMDVGVCNLCGQNMYDFCTALGNRLKAVVLRDGDSNSETAMLPFTCADGGKSHTDWLNLIRGLRQIEFDGKLILNLTDTAAAFPPVLRPGLLHLAKSVANYLKWQIGIEVLLKKYPSKVLFGAGNMCRNYMKCYGEKYPPLYTCDNNKALWGKDFCGLKIKSPESLKELPQDCTIFICNIYYREIERQLREMGITNRIEYFNDEYMPTFYFDRLEAHMGNGIC